MLNPQAKAATVLKGPDERSVSTMLLKGGTLMLLKGGTLWRIRAELKRVRLAFQANGEWGERHISATQVLDRRLG
jgi:hypothetical protein